MTDEPTNQRPEELEVRAQEAGDADALRELYAQPLAYTNTLQLPYPATRLWQRRCEALPDGHLFLVACWSGRVVGNIGLNPQPQPRRRHAASLGMGVHDDFAGRGIGDALLSEALTVGSDWLGVKRFELTVFADNTRAIGLYLKHGFEQEGVLRDYALRDGEFVDALTMSRLVR